MYRYGIYFRNMSENPSMTNKETDYLIIGAGVAGLSLALKLSRLGRVMLIAKSDLIDSNSWYAQGGIASVLGEEDTFEEHIQDTLVAGAGLCHEEIVSLVVREGPDAIQELIDLGVQFDKEKDGDEQFHLTREGGHSRRRVIHAKDLTGKEVISSLLHAVRSAEAITILENHIAIDLLTTDKYQPDFSRNSCLGAFALDKITGAIHQIRSRATFLCTGGHGRLYQFTSNPMGSTGDGLAMAWRAGCRVANLEFMQFHPTCLFHPGARSFLISEAVRGEGAILKNRKGEEFMDSYHPLKSLAPRDVVARAIDFELKKSGEPHVYLDASAIGAANIREHFPNIYKTCMNFGIDMTRDMIPVVPAAHYSCGGVVVDRWGRTGIHQLFALGEVAGTGLHGANRLASNSLLEALVFADRAYRYVAKELVEDLREIQVPPWNFGHSVTPDEFVVLSQNWDEIRRLMWNYVGIVRTQRRLTRALDRITIIRNELNRYYWDYRITEKFLEVRNLADVAWLAIRSALSRKESRGIHFNLDYPETYPAAFARDTIIW